MQCYFEQVFANRDLFLIIIFSCSIYKYFICDFFLYALVYIFSLEKVSSKKFKSSYLKIFRELAALNVLSNFFKNPAKESTWENYYFSGSFAMVLYRDLTKNHSKYVELFGIIRVVRSQKFSRTLTFLAP